MWTIVTIINSHFVDIIIAGEGFDNCFIFTSRAVII